MSDLEDELPVAGPWQELASAALLPRVGVATARTFNRLYARRPAWPITLGGNAYTLQWSFEAESASCRELYCFRLGSHAGCLGLDAFATELMFDGERQSQRIPVELRYVLLADKLVSLVERVEQLTRQPFEWVVVGTDAAAVLHNAAASDAARFVLSPLAGGRSCEGFIRFDDPAAFEPVLGAARLDAQVCGAHLNAMRLPVSFGLGSTSLCIAELKSIRPGDILRIDTQMRPASALCVTLVVNSWPQGHITALADGPRITVQPFKDRTMTSAPPVSAGPTTQADTAGGAQIDNLGGLEVTLRFEVGALSMTLRELKSIGAGHVFELPEPLQRSAVRIVAQGNLLGKGHLVAVGDRLGVRITEFAAGLNE